MTRETFIANVASDLANNTTGLIDAIHVRRNIMDLANNAFMAEDVGTTTGKIAAGDDSRIVNAVPKSTHVIANTGLSGGGNLEANVSLSVVYGTSGSTSAEGNDIRLSNEREWKANNVITPTTFESYEDVANYAPAGYETASVWRLSTNTATTMISGIAGGYDGRVIVLHNLGPQDIYIADQAVTSNSNSENRIMTLGLSWAIIYRYGGSLILWYDGISQRWRTVTNAPILADSSKAIGLIDDISLMTPAKTKESVDALTLGKQTIFIPAAAMTPTTTNGAEAGTTELATNDVMLSYLAFDSSTTEHAQFSIQMPKGWNEDTLIAQFIWTHPATTTNFVVVWGIRAVAFANDDAMDTLRGTTAYTVDTGGTTSDCYISDETGAMTVAGSPGPEEFVVFEIFREPANVNDTMAVDAYLLGVKIHYTIDAAKDD